MWKYTRYLVKSLDKEESLSPQEIQNLGIKYSTIRIKWDKLYFDFGYEDELFHPVEGSYSLMRNSTTKIKAKSYTCEDLADLISTGTELIVIENNYIPYDQEIVGVTSSIHPYFDSVKINKYKDYSEIISDLGKRNIVDIICSVNTLSTDCRKFKILPKAIEIHNPITQYYNSFYYEVDCLGCTLFDDLTTSLEKIWLLT